MAIANKFRIKFFIFFTLLLLMFYLGKVEGEVGWCIAIGFIAFISLMYTLAIEDKCALCGCYPSQFSNLKSVNPYTYMFFTGCCPGCKK